MIATLVGIVIGVLSSLVAGVILLWKGDQFIDHLKKRPTKRRVVLYTRAYLHVLHAYPYHTLHLFAITLLHLISTIVCLTYVAITCIAFVVSYSGSPEVTRATLYSHFSKDVLAAYNSVIVPWIFAGLTIFLVVWNLPPIYRALAVDRLAPYAHREIQRLRECVAKCGTAQQFIAYTDAEHNVKTVDDLRMLITQAKTIIGPCGLADEIMADITDDGSAA